MIFSEKRPLYNVILMSENTMASKKFHENMRYNSDPDTLNRRFNELLYVPQIGKWVAIDRHAATRYDERVIQGLSEKELKRTRVPSNEETIRRATEELVSFLTAPHVMEKLLAEDAYIGLDDKNVPAASREDGVGVIVCRRSNGIHLVVSYSYECVFLSTVLVTDNPGSDWENAVVLDFDV